MSKTKKRKKPKLLKISYNISDHDLEHKKKQVDKWIAKGLEVKVQLFLRGREKYIYEGVKDELVNRFSEYKIVNSWQRGNNYYLFIR